MQIRNEAPVVVHLLPWLCERSIRGSSWRQRLVDYSKNTQCYSFDLVYCRRQSFLGQSSWISFDHQSGGRRKVLLASEAGVLSAVNAASGKIGKWEKCLV